jgi:hypothetical protein
MTEWLPSGGTRRIACGTRGNNTSSPIRCASHRYASGRILHLALIAALFELLSAQTRAEPSLPQFGCSGGKRHAVITLEGRIKQGGLEGRFSMQADLQNGGYLVQRDFGLFSEGTGFDGKTAWSRDRSGASHDLNAKAAHAIAITESWILRHGWCGAHNAVTQQIPDETDTVWQVTPDGGVTATLRFARDSGALLQSEYRVWGNRLVRHYGDWRDIGDGVSVAFSERDEDPEDEDSEEVAITSAHLDSKFSANSRFRRPAQPADYEILGGADSTTVPYEDDGAARIYVPVFVGGKGPFAFEIDTGGHLILGKDLAATLQLSAAGSFANTGAGTGILQAGMVAGQEIRIGDALLHRQVAKVRSFVNDRTTGHPPRLGLLGLELFERFAVAVDRGKKTVTLTPLEGFKSGKGIALPIRFIEDAPLTEGSYRGVKGDFEIDSGNAGPTLIEGYWAKHHALEKALMHGTPWIGGTGEKEWLSRADLTLGTVKLPHEIVSYVGEAPRGAESTHLQAGLSGEWALRRYDMTYDYRHGVVWIGQRHGGPEPPSNHTGLQIRKLADALTAANVFPGSPADVAGIKPGDRILAAGGHDASTLTVRDAAFLMQGPIDSDLTVVIAPAAGGDAKTLKLRLVELVR